LLEGTVQGEDEHSQKEQDIEQMSSSPARSLDRGSESAASLGGPRIYALSPYAQEQIGRRLAAAYDEILRQPIPDRFRLLLDQLDQATNETKERSPAKETEIE